MSNRYFDPALLHHWTTVGQTGEWPTVDISPMCSPSIKRTISTSDLPADEPTPTDTDNVCPVCREITVAIEARA